MDHRDPVPRVGHTRTLRPRAASVQSLPPDTDPPRQIHMGRGHGSHRLLRKRTHTRETPAVRLQNTNHKQAAEYKSQTCKAGDRVKTNLADEKNVSKSSRF